MSGVAASDELVLHHLNASRSLRLLWLLEELGVPFSVKAYHRVDGRAPPALSQVHPLGKSPVITDGGVVVAESGNIVEHLLATRDAARALQPTAGDAAGNAMHRFILHYAEGSVMPLIVMDYVLRIVVEKTPWVGRPITRAVRDAVYANFVGPELDRHARYLDGVLSRSAFIACDHFTAADAHLLGGVEGMLADPARAAVSPALVAWAARLRQRPAYLRAASRDKELAEMK
jgi:glutathione S-transferase